MPDSETDIKQPVTPEADKLSYSESDIKLSRRPIDWEITRPEDLEAMPAEEREAVLREQHRRIYYALRDLSRALGKVIPPEDGVTIYERVNKLLNPDQYPLTPEAPEVEPTD